MTNSTQPLDLVGVGVGPANLSLAALLSRSPELSVAFLERKPAFEWHPGLMVPGAEMQVHFLKDLVTPADPTNPLSFVSFLVETRRFYRLLVTGRSKVPRKEFEQYCRWAADKLDSLRFGTSVETVEWDGDAFSVHTPEGRIRARNIVSGTGLKALLPNAASGQDPARVFHAEQLLKEPRQFAGKRVALVGGGQSGAEVLQYLLADRDQLPESILWGTRRSNLHPLDDSPFLDELFVPNYSRHFYSLPEDDRAHLLQEQRMASDGISVGLLDSIYGRLYDLELLEQVEQPCRILLDHTLAGIADSADGLVTSWRSARTGTQVREAVDVVICATGYEHDLMDLLQHMKHRLTLSHGRPVIRPDFSLDWDGPAGNRIYVQNAARQEFGVADPNLSLLAWRSAVIANSLLGQELYGVGPVSAALDWPGETRDETREGSDLRETSDLS